MKRSVIFFIFFVLVISLLTTQAENLAESNELGDREIVVLLHGLARSNKAMWHLKQRLEEAGFYVEAVSYPSLNQTPQQIIQNISQQIDECCKLATNRVHFVGHSLAGLLIRAYLTENHPQNLGRAVLIGTPNQGAEVADYVKDKWWAQFAGPAALSLGTSKDSFPKTIPEPDYPVGIIAGVTPSDNDHIIPGLDDGLVSVESTKLKNMHDFITIPSGHSMMRYNKSVATQTIHFLKSGHFEK
ncbi:MAG: alpha/beta fold hydrolase [Candidatus Thiodiazotropha sp. L084R]